MTDAVVNISAAQVTEEKQASTAPKPAPGTPLDDLFEQFFKRQLGRHGGSGGGDEDAPRGRRANSLGSGFIIDGAGIVITNNHVIEGANDITVILTDGTKLKAEVVGKDSKVDVAVLKVTPTHPLKSVPFGDSDAMRVGDAVMAVGNPFGLGGTVTAGIVSARNRNIDSGPYDNYIQTDASINKGNSGGPLFDMKGEVIGINTAILSPSGGSIGIGFATPSDTVLPIIAQLREFHEVRRGWLGVRIQPVTDDIAEALGLGTPHGALVAGIDDKGPAGPAGLKKGDVIVGFDGHDVHESRDLPKFVAGAPVGKDVVVSILRDGKPQELTVKLGRLDAPVEKASLDRDQGAADAPQVRRAAGLRPRARHARRCLPQALRRQGQREGRRRRHGRARLGRRRQAEARRCRGGGQPGGGGRPRRRRRQDEGRQGRRQEDRAPAGVEPPGRRPLRGADAQLTGPGASMAPRLTFCAVEAVHPSRPFSSAAAP